MDSTGPPPPLPPQIPQYYPSDPIVFAAPPPPPPKPNSNNASRTGTPYNGNNQQYPPPPPLPSGSGPNAASTSSTAFTPGLPVELYIPPILLDKGRDDLLYLLSSPHLLDSLYTSQHPSSPIHSSTLTTSLTANSKHSQKLISLSQHLESARHNTSQLLLKTRALERSWREKENEMDVALNKFSARALHARLGQAVGEAEAVGRALEESFLEDDGLDYDGDLHRGISGHEARGGLDGNSGGGVSGSGNGTGSGGAGKVRKTSRDVDNFVKSYRGVRALYHLRKERKERWDENRVGGWR